MPIHSLLQKSVAIGFTLLLFYAATLFGDNIKTVPQWILGTLMLLCLLLHHLLPRKSARLLFCIWAAISTFLLLWIIGYELAMWQFGNCFTNDTGEKYCAMPTGQLLLGLIFAIIGEIIILRKLRHFSQPKWERIWQISALAGLIVGAIYQCFLD